MLNLLKRNPWVLLHGALPVLQGIRPILFRMKQQRHLNQTIFILRILFQQLIKRLSGIGPPIQC